MFNFHASDILQHWSVTHALAVRQTNERTLSDMKRLPEHLIADVNARAVPHDIIGLIQTDSKQCQINQ